MMPNHFRSLRKIALFSYRLASPDVNHHDNALVDQSAALGETTCTPKITCWQLANSDISPEESKAYRLATAPL